MFKKGPKDRKSQKHKTEKMNSTVLNLILGALNLSKIITVDTIWNIGETGDIN